AGTIDGTVAWFQNPRSEVSSHYLIGHSGRVVQMVDEGNTAWHAGVFLKFNNQDSIGIEHEGGTFPDGRNEHLGEEGYLASARLIADIPKRYGWGEPSSRTVKTHGDLQATSCPSGLDVLRLIQLAQDEY